MTAPVEGGGTVHGMLESLVGKTKEPPQLKVGDRYWSLTPPDVDMGEYQALGGMLYAVFTELSKHRGRAESGPVPITWPDLQAYLSVNRLELDPVEVDIVMHLDHIFVTALSERVADEIERMKASH